MLTIVQIARVCHGANAEYCASIGDNSQKSWDEAEEWQRASAISGVKFTIHNQDAPASAQHEAWVLDKVRDGWKYGPTKDANAKTHPCIVPYGELPLEQRLKDYIFRAIVRAFIESDDAEAAVRA